MGNTTPTTKTDLSETPLFELGKVRFTPGALTGFVLAYPSNLEETDDAKAIREALQVAENAARELLIRHSGGDFGDLDEEDKRTNRRAIRTGTRVLSCYHLPVENAGSIFDYSKLYIITEWHRQLTTVMLADEY